MPSAFFQDSLPASLDGKAGHAGAWPRGPHRTEDVCLLGSTHQWLSSLPRGVRPMRVQAQFPRIANELFHLWNDPAKLDRFFSDKAFNSRGVREGFPPIVREGLLALHIYSLRTRLLRAGKLAVRWGEYETAVARRLQPARQRSR